ncbi:hypothetical protein [Streptomyces sp. NPDC017448]|uniref:hypothetical protein n=1 Tax=Streptomyces sp. NPDC017448 TaxID=3364996 RepID=UPI0037918652
MTRQHYRSTLAQFHQAFDVKPYGQLAPIERLALIPLRATLIAEETRELIEAISDVQHNPTEQNQAHLAKECADLLYVTTGTAHLLDLPFVDPRSTSTTRNRFHAGMMVEWASDFLQISLDDYFRGMDRKYEPELLEIMHEELAPDIQQLGDAVHTFATAWSIPLALVFDAVHASNMSKLDPATSQAILREDGKVLKGPGYFEPDITRILRAAG